VISGGHWGTPKGHVQPYLYYKTNKSPDSAKVQWEAAQSAYNNEAYYITR